MNPHQSIIYERERSLIQAISHHVQWDIFEARRMAAMLLEDVNDHEEAARLFKLAKGEDA